MSVVLVVVRVKGGTVYQGAVCRPKEGLEVVLMYSNEGVQDRNKIRKRPETRMEQRVKEGGDRGDQVTVW